MLSAASHPRPFGDAFRWNPAPPPRVIWALGLPAAHPRPLGAPHHSCQASPRSSSVAPGLAHLSCLVPPHIPSADSSPPPGGLRHVRDSWTLQPRRGWVRSPALGSGLTVSVPLYRNAKQHPLGSLGTLTFGSLSYLEVHLPGCEEARVT